MSLYLVLTQHHPPMVTAHYCTYLVIADSYGDAERRVRNTNSFSEDDEVLKVQYLEPESKDERVHFMVYSETPYDETKIGLL